MEFRQNDLKDKLNGLKKELHGFITEGFPAINSKEQIHQIFDLITDSIKESLEESKREMLEEFERMDEFRHP
ncbi:MAG: hypothetical protein MRY78_10590 [Saprospiraceae bacterium]|nr:hypothetical protein [Saprospiraceae bacterium]